jgi:hypothetical protein
VGKVGENWEIVEIVRIRAILACLRVHVGNARAAAVQERSAILLSSWVCRGAIALIRTAFRARSQQRDDDMLVGGLGRYEI